MRATTLIAPRLPAGSVGEVLDPDVRGTVLHGGVAKVKFDALPDEPFYVERWALEVE